MNTSDSRTWPAKTPVERVTAQFDFTPDLQPGDFVVSAVVNATTVSGTDAQPSLVLNGLPQIKGRRVFQRLANGVAGCSYQVDCTATTNLGDVFQLVRVLPVHSTQIY